LVQQLNGPCIGKCCGRHMLMQLSLMVTHLNAIYWMSIVVIAIEAMNMTGCPLTFNPMTCCGLGLTLCLALSCQLLNIGSNILVQLK
jgi:hypothetical protein